MSASTENGSTAEMRLVQEGLFDAAILEKLGGAVTEKTFKISLTLIRHGMSAANAIEAVCCKVPGGRDQKNKEPLRYQAQGGAEVQIAPSSITLVDYMRSIYAPNALLTEQGIWQPVAAAHVFRANSHVHKVGRFDLITSSVLRRAIRTSSTFASAVHQEGGAEQELTILPGCAEERKPIIEGTGAFSDLDNHHEPRAFPAPLACQVAWDYAEWAENVQFKGQADLRAFWGALAGVLEDKRRRGLAAPADQPLNVLLCSHNYWLQNLVSQVMRSGGYEDEESKQLLLRTTHGDPALNYKSVIENCQVITFKEMELSIKPSHASASGEEGAGYEVRVRLDPASSSGAGPGGSGGSDECLYVQRLDWTRPDMWEAAVPQRGGGVAGCYYNEQAAASSLAASAKMFQVGMDGFMAADGDAEAFLAAEYATDRDAVRASELPLEDRSMRAYIAAHFDGPALPPPSPDKKRPRDGV